MFSDKSKYVEYDQHLVKKKTNYENVKSEFMVDYIALTNNPKISVA